MARLSKRRRKLTSKVWLLLLGLLALGVVEIILIWHQIEKPPKTSNSSKTSSTSHTSSAELPPAFNKKLYSVDEASSLWAVVNKGRILPSSYVPANLIAPSVPLRYGASSLEMHLRSDAAMALEQMVASAKSQGIDLMLASGYRSYSNQVATYNGYVKADGVAKADTYSARPGHSEHQTGLAADLEPASRKCELQVCFADTAEGKWLATNAYKYGFIIRYQVDSQSLTGYQYEPWHTRFVGTDLATEINKTGQTLEQFFGLPIYASYPTQNLQLQ